MPSSPFIGPSYALRNRYGSVARTVNLMPRPIEPGNERTDWIFVDVEGLVEATSENPATYYTSWPYPIFTDDAFEAGATIPVGGQLWLPPLEEFEGGPCEPLSGTLATILVDYDAPPLEWEGGPCIPLSGTLETTLESYPAPAEEFEGGPCIPLSGTLVRVLITYDDWPPDEFEAGPCVPLSGTLV